MKKIIRYEGVPLTEGHSGVSLVVENGIVVEGFYYALVPVRGFEKLLVGQDAVVAPLITSRICGLCQVTHGIASAEAIEDAAGIEIPEGARLLREVLGLSVRVYNNLLHQIMVSGDFFKDEEERLAFVRQVQKIRKVVAHLLESIGGEIIHPKRVVVGGISEPLEEFLKEKLLEMVDSALPLLKEVNTLFCNALEEFWKRVGLPEDFGRHGGGFFATDLYYGKKVDVDKFEFVYPQQVFSDELKRDIGNAFVLFEGRIVETGPRARRVVFKKFTPKGGIKELYYLRSLENVEALERIKEILSNNSFEKELMNPTFPSSDGEKLGIGVHEAPRGVNVHAVRLDRRGKILYYKIVVPTEINFLPIAEAMKGVKAEYVDYIVRAYDPCIVCSAH